MTKLYLVAASFCIAGNATSTPPANIPDVFCGTNNIYQVDTDEDDGSVVINGFKCYLRETDGTFSISEIVSLSSEDLVVPYTVTYEGKRYHCDEVKLGCLRAKARPDETIIPNVKNVTFSEGIKKLTGHFPLNRCKKVTIPSTVESIEETSFNYGVSAGYSNKEEHDWWLKNYYVNFTCFDLEEFVVDKDSKYFTAKDGLLYTKDMKTLVSCPRNKKGTVVVPEGVEELATACFCICTRLTEIQLPSTVRSLGDPVGGYAGFYYCLSLEKINIPEGVETLTGCAFRYCAKLKSLTLPTTLKTLDVQYNDGTSVHYAPVFGPMYSLEKLDMENTSIEVIEGKYNATPFTEVCKVKDFRLPKNIRTIGSSALCGMNPPAELHLPATIESLGEKFIDPFKKYSSDSFYGSTCKQTESPIKDIYCYWTTPLEVADNIFGYVKISGDKVFPQDWADICTLHVLAGTAEAYRANNVWGKFKNIVEFTPTGIDAVRDNISVKNPTGVYTLQGVKVAENGGQLENLPSGIYIVDGKKTVMR